MLSTMEFHSLSYSGTCQQRTTAHPSTRELLCEIHQAPGPKPSRHGVANLERLPSRIVDDQDRHAVSPPDTNITHDTPNITKTKTIPLPTLSQGITLASAVKAAWALILSHVTSTTDIVFGKTVNGRSLPMPDIERILGPYVNYIPARPSQTREQQPSHPSWNRSNPNTSAQCHSTTSASPTS